MSNQRSCILFIALVIILLYLYYESVGHKVEQPEDGLDTKPSHNDELGDTKVTFGRRLLYSIEDVAKPRLGKEISSRTLNSHKFRTLNTFPDTGQENKLKRIKRNTRNKRGIYKWKFNVSVSRLDNESIRTPDDLKNLNEESSNNKEDFLDIELYVDGKTKQFKALEHSWEVVRDSLRNFYEETRDPRKSNALSSQNLTTQTNLVGAEESITKNDLIANSGDSFSLTIQKGSEKSVQEQTNQKTTGRQGKFFIPNFGIGGNKENPPLEPGIGDNLVKGTSTESMHDLSFINSTEQFEIKNENVGVFSSTLLPEHLDLDRPLAEPTLSLTTKSEPKSDFEIDVTTLGTKSPTLSNEILNCEDCAILEAKTDSANVNAVQITTPKSVIDISSDSIEMFCSNFVKNLQKSPRLEDQLSAIVNGNSDTNGNIENLKETDAGSGSLDANEKVESLILTTQTATTMKTIEQQSGLLHRLWNRLQNLSGRNQRKISDEDLEISGFPKNFSVEDCKELFFNQIKSEFTSLSTLEESILTEPKTTLAFSTDNFISIENNSESNLNFDGKLESLKGEEIKLITDSFDNKQSKSTATQTTEKFLHTTIIPEKFTTIRNSSHVDVVSFKQIESVTNSDKITSAEFFKNEDAVEQPQPVNLIEISNTATSRSETLTQSNSASFRSKVENQDRFSSPINFEIVTTEIIIQENKRFFSDLNNDAILQLGPSDEKSNESINALNKTEFGELILSQTPSISKDQRFFFGFNGGSGARELPDSTDNDFNLSESGDQRISDDLFMNEIPKTNVSDDFRTNTNKNEFVPVEVFDQNIIKKNEDISTSTDFIASFRSDNASLSEQEAISVDDFINDEIMVNVSLKMQTNSEVLMDTFDGSDLFPRNKDPSEQNFDFISSGDGRDISEVSFNDSTGFILSAKNAPPSVICNDCENTSNNKSSFAAVEYSLRKPCTDCSNFNTTIPSNIHDNDVSLPIAKQFPIEPSPIDEVISSPSTISHSKESIDMKTSNPFEIDQRLIDLSIEHETESSNTDKIHFVTEPKITAPPTQSKEARSSVLMPNIPDFTTKSETTIREISNINDSRNIKKLDTTNIDSIYVTPESETSVSPSKLHLPSRGARFDNLSFEPKFTSKIETTTNTISANFNTNDSKIINLLQNEANSIKSSVAPSKPLLRNRGARFNDVIPTEKSDFTSKTDLNGASFDTNINEHRFDKFLNKSEVGVIKNDQKTFKPSEILFESEKTLPNIGVPQTTQSVNLFQSRRGARGHDIFDLESLDSTTLISDVKEESVTENENGINSPPSVENVDENDIPNSTGLLKTSNIFSSEIPNAPSTSVVLQHSSTVSSIQPSSTENIDTMETNLNPELKLPSLKFCHSASVCNASLNERCMPNDDLLICDCGRAFRRNLDTKKCEATITLQTSISLPGAKFHEDLRNRNTEEFQRKKMDYIKTMWFLLKHDPKLFRTVAEIDISSFEEGSLIVKYTMKLLNSGNETASELVELLEEDLTKLINDEDLLKSISLELKNASVSTFALNPCLSSDMNYCHKNALCIPTEEKGFKCECKADYLDTSREKRYPGENCTGFCAADYCGEHGKCNVLETGAKQCICSGWYFGEKCEISGIIVIAGFAFANILVIILVVLLVFCCKKKKNPSLYNRNVANFQPGQDRCLQTGDAITLDEVVHNRKFMAISTPMCEVTNPVIQVTSPSFPGSSISYDSTFDRSPCISDTSKNESESAPKA